LYFIYTAGSSVKVIFVIVTLSVTCLRGEGIGNKLSYTVFSQVLGQR